MAEKRGRVSKKVIEEDIGDDPTADENQSTGPIPFSETRLARLQLRLRKRWELASVLNFLHVFQPVIKTGLAISAEEIETALIVCNPTLAELHIALLKGIPPVSKSLTSPDAWVTLLCKKLDAWWPWVAEGEISLIAAHGVEISIYKELDPSIRLLILKALCEIRADQDDALRYVNDVLKHEREPSIFRKERLGGDENGTAYWYDGDSVIGHRLYCEKVNVEFRLRLKGKGRLAQPTIRSHWETLATNLDEFRDKSDKLSCSKIMVEADVAQVVKSEILPVLEKLLKKKEMALKRQQRQAMLLDGFINTEEIANSRSLRGRIPVSYTFDEYDRCIDEAIHVGKKIKTAQGPKDENGAMENKKTRLSDVEDDNDDDLDYHDTMDDESDNYSDDLGSSNNDNHSHVQMASSDQMQKQKDLQAKVVVGLHRSHRISESTDYDVHDINNMETKRPAGMKKRLRERSVSSKLHIISDSEDGNP